jgi:hypothetical protein
MSVGHALGTLRKSLSLHWEVWWPRMSSPQSRDSSLKRKYYFKIQYPQNKIQTTLYGLRNTGIKYSFKLRIMKKVTIFRGHESVCGIALLFEPDTIQQRFTPELFKSYIYISYFNSLIFYYLICSIDECQYCHPLDKLL